MKNHHQNRSVQALPLETEDFNNITSNIIHKSALNFAINKKFNTK